MIVAPLYDLIINGYRVIKSSPGVEACAPVDGRWTTQSCLLYVIRRLFRISPGLHVEWTFDISHLHLQRLQVLLFISFSFFRLESKTSPTAFHLKEAAVLLQSSCFTPSVSYPLIIIYSQGWRRQTQEIRFTERDDKQGNLEDHATGDRFCLLRYYSPSLALFCKSLFRNQQLLRLLF